jgi:hypothetical protein
MIHGPKVGIKPIKASDKEVYSIYQREGCADRSIAVIISRSMVAAVAAIAGDVPATTPTAANNAGLHNVLKRRRC